MKPADEWMGDYAGGIRHGVWPVMLTPFTDLGEVDYAGLEQLVEWYIAHGVSGLFAVCQSSEMFWLSLKERADIAAFVKEKARNRVQVVASGHISDDIGLQVEEIKRIAATGVDAVVWVTNRLAAEHEPDGQWIRQAEYMLEQVPDVAFGLYECPYPYKRLLSPELLKWCRDSGRFSFLKDTCCDPERIERRLELLRGGTLQIFNANTTTLLSSLARGAAGYSGIMANFHPDLYVLLCRQVRDAPGPAAAIQSLLDVAAVCGHQNYPLSAKYYLGVKEGLNIGLHTRSSSEGGLTRLQRMELESLKQATDLFRRWGSRLD